MVFPHCTWVDFEPPPPLSNSTLSLLWLFFSQLSITQLVAASLTADLFLFGAKGSPHLERCLGLAGR